MVVVFGLGCKSVKRVWLTISQLELVRSKRVTVAMRAKTSKTSKERKEKKSDILITENPVDAPPRATTRGVAARSGAPLTERSQHTIISSQERGPGKLSWDTKGQWRRHGTEKIGKAPSVSHCKVIRQTLMSLS
jgi:hypothetical protein